MRDQLLALPKATILDLFRSLNGGGVGFDHERSKKTECVDRLMGLHTEDAIRDAMAKVVIDVETTTTTAPKALPAVSTNGATHGIDQNAVAAQIGALFASLAGSAVNEAKVQAIVDAAIKDAVGRLVNRVEVKVAEQPAIDVGIQHERFPLLVKACSARTPDGKRLNVWLTGPAGSGKTTAAKMVAKAFNLPFFFNGAIGAQYELLGFIDANGTYRTTPFRQAWENGGVYIFDEVDGSNPNAVLAFNAALANGVCAFPDGMVERHDDFVCLAGANTSGNGATQEHSGRMKQDAAFLDRFVELDWPVDEKLERAICHRKEWAQRVQGVRQRINERGIRGHRVTPRATVFGAALLDAGIDITAVERMTLRKGLAEDAWTQIQ